MSIEKRKRDDVEKEDAEDDKNWSGAREGYYFGTNEKGVLGYHLDPLHGNKTSVGRREDVSTKESGSVTTGYLRVKDCISKKDEGKNEPKRPEISRKKMKKLLKMTPDERLLLGFGYLDQKKDDLKIHRHEPSKDEKYSDLAPEVVAVIKAQQRNKIPDRYSDQKRKPGSNEQRQAIYLLQKSERDSERSKSRLEEKKKSATVRDNKPCWL